MINKIILFLGKKTVDFFSYIFDLFTLLVLTLKTTSFRSLRGTKQFQAIVRNQIIFTGIDALPIISVLALGLGLIVIVQLVTQLSKVGASEMVGKILVMVVVRELSPLLTALLVISRSGSAMATELGTMKINQEVDALDVMGINPLKFIVFPRLVSCVIAMVCLTVYFNLIAIIGGFVVGTVQLKISFIPFMENIIGAFDFKDIFSSLLKSFLFGITIPLVCCYHGLGVGKSPTEIPQSASLAIVNSIIFCMIIDGIVTVLSYI